MSQYPLARTIIPHSIGAAGPLLAPAHADTAHRLRQRRSCGAARRAVSQPRPRHVVVQIRVYLEGSKLNAKL